MPRDYRDVMRFNTEYLNTLCPNGFPRHNINPEPGSYPFEWSRRQFPICIAFATTINKSQGQTLKRVGVWLRCPVFSHGQLYVASSRTVDPNGLKFAIKEQPGHGKGNTPNEVYKEVLLPWSISATCLVGIPEPEVILNC